MVQLCTQNDVVESDGLFKLRRSVALKGRVKIEANSASNFNPQGGAYDGNREKRTHLITMRYNPQLIVTNLAWIYEARRKSAPRWFKILKVKQTEDAGPPYFVFDCKLRELSDLAPEPAPNGTFRPTVPLPDGIDL